MSSKTLQSLKRIVAVLAILIICSMSSVNAFSLGFRDYRNYNNYNYSYNSNRRFGGMFSSILERIFNREGTQEYSLSNLQTDLETMRDTGNYDMNKISELIDKLPSGENKSIVEGLKNMYTKLQELVGQIDIKGILDKLIDTIKSLLGGIGTSSGLPVEAQSGNINAVTAVQFAGEDYNAKLHASIYEHVDENGNKDSDKWVVLIHPFMLKGETIAKRVGPYYYEKGYNIIAPDLRSFGESEGKVSLGFLESLDIYDWLNAINNTYHPSEVIVHGISLGGATTNYLSGIDQFLANGPTKMDTRIKSLRELNVVGLVEDCGYTNMTQFANKSFLLNMGIGLTEENFEYYSDATNSLKYCDIPMLIIQGTADTMVKPENAETVKNTVKGEVDYWSVEGGAHAFIIIGMNGEEYKAHVQAFIDKVG